MAFLDVRALRDSGMLQSIAGAKPMEEAEYKQFVDETGFDYRRDLDALFLSNAPADTYFLLSGRFDWGRLQSYASKQGGGCSHDVCRVKSTTPGRTVSYARIRGGTLGMASSTDPDAVNRLLAKPSAPTAEPPSKDPVWFAIPSNRLKDESLMPTGTRMFASALMSADRVVLSIGPRDKRFDATLAARFASIDQSAQALIELKTATTMLNKMLRLEHREPNPRDLTGVLGKGEFRIQGEQLTAIWPIERAFFEALTGGAN